MLRATPSFGQDTDRRSSVLPLPPPSSAWPSCGASGAAVRSRMAGPLPGEGGALTGHAATQEGHGRGGRDRSGQVRVGWGTSCVRRSSSSTQVERGARANTAQARGGKQARQSQRRRRPAATSPCAGAGLRGKVALHGRSVGLVSRRAGPSPMASILSATRLRSAGQATRASLWVAPTPYLHTAGPTRGQGARRGGRPGHPGKAGGAHAAGPPRVRLIRTAPEVHSPPTQSSLGRAASEGRAAAPT